MTGGTDRPTTQVGRAGIAVRPMAATDAGHVLTIYQAGMGAGNASIETTAPAWADFDAARLPAHRFVAEAGGVVVGWIAVSPASARAVYAGVGVRERVGRHHGRWRDVVLIERRSPTIT